MVTDGDMETAAVRFPYNTPGGMVKVPPRRRPSSAPAFPGRAWQLRLAQRSLGRGRPTGRPATASGARASRLQSRRFPRLRPFRPGTKEGCYFRTIFHSHFPNNNYGNGIETTVPGGPSVACSTAKAIEWDASWSDPTRQDQSGRFVDTHDDNV